jgi:hypothetical protein
MVCSGGIRPGREGDRAAPCGRCPDAGWIDNSDGADKSGEEYFVLFHLCVEAYDGPVGVTKNKSLMFNLGAFVGHITRAVREPAVQAKPQVVNSTAQQQSETLGDVTLRRTVIEEVIYHPGETSHATGAHSSSSFDQEERPRRADDARCAADGRMPRG